MHPRQSDPNVQPQCSPEDPDGPSLSDGYEGTPPRANARPHARKTKHPWDEIRRRFIQGDEGGENNRGSRHWPTTGDLAREYGAQPPAVSRAANAPDPDGKNWYDHRQAFREELQRKLNNKTTELISNQQAKFRATTFEAAARVMDGATRTMRNDDPSPGNLKHLAGAIKIAQQVGETTIDQAKEAAPKPKEEIDDWTIMSSIRRGAKLEDILK